MRWEGARSVCILFIIPNHVYCSLITIKLILMKPSKQLLMIWFDIYCGALSWLYDDLISHQMFHPHLLINIRLKADLLPLWRKMTSYTPLGFSLPITWENLVGHGPRTRQWKPSRWAQKPYLSTQNQSPVRVIFAVDHVQWASKPTGVACGLKLLGLESHDTSPTYGENTFGEKLLGKIYEVILKCWKKKSFIIFIFDKWFCQKCFLKTLLNTVSESCFPIAIYMISNLLRNDQRWQTSKN